MSNKSSHTKSDSSEKSPQTKSESESSEKSPQTKSESESSKKGAVNVVNLTKTWFVQPGSGIRLEAGKTQPLNDDGWLQSQIDAGFLKKV